MPATELDLLSINTIRFLSVDAVQKANSGHPGLPMGAAPMAYVLWTRFLEHDPADPRWFDRDRFVLSAGHGSMLLYSLLHLGGLRTDARGDPELPPVGQPHARPSGERPHARGRSHHRPARPGDLQRRRHGDRRGAPRGSLQSAGARSDRPLHLRAGERRRPHGRGGLRGLLPRRPPRPRQADRALRRQSHQSRGIDVGVLHRGRRRSLRGVRLARRPRRDGNDLDGIERAITNARREVRRPSIVMVRTEIGYGAPHKGGTFEAHGSPLGPEEVKAAKENLGWPTDPPFYIPKEALAHLRRALEDGKAAHQRWNERMAAYERAFPELAARSSSDAWRPSCRRAGSRRCRASTPTRRASPRARPRRR